MTKNSKAILYITYKDGFAEVEIERDGVREKLDKRYQNVNGISEWEFCNQVSKTVEGEIGTPVKWVTTKQRKRTKKDKVIMVIGVGFAITASVALIVLFFICMAAAGQHLNNAEKLEQQQESTPITTPAAPKPTYVPDTTPTQEYVPPTPQEIFQFGDGIDDSNELYMRYIGTVTNMSNETHYFVKVKGTFKDDNGNAIDTTSTFACGDEGLAPGETTKFTLSVPRDDRITTISCSVFDYR